MKVAFPDYSQKFSSYLAAVMFLLKRPMNFLYDDPNPEVFLYNNISNHSHHSFNIMGFLNGIPPVISSSTSKTIAIANQRSSGIAATSDDSFITLN